MSDKKKKQNRDTKPATLVEVQAEINREMQQPFTTEKGVSGVVQRLMAREGLIKQALQMAIGDSLLMLTARTPVTSMHNTLPNLQRLRNLMREPNAPEQVDSAYLYALKTQLTELAYKAYKRDGRGALVILLSDENDKARPAWYSEQAIKEQKPPWAAALRKHITSYNPEEEGIVAIIRSEDDVRVYKLELPWWSKGKLRG